MGIEVYAYIGSIRGNHAYANNNKKGIEEMRFKIVQCLSRDIVDAEKDVWIYAWKEWVGLSKNSDTEKSVYPHRVPWFLSLHAHLRSEEALEDLTNMIFTQFPFKKLLFVYDVLHGTICAYNMKEILEWWKNRPDDD
jgi:hypothetical protein